MSKSRYLARTDSDFTPLPERLPHFGRAGSIFRDPSFNSTFPPQYARVTDDQSFIGWDGSPSSFSVGPGSGDDQHFNLDDMLLWVTNQGAAMFIFGLVPETMQTELVSAVPIPTTYGNGHFSVIDRHWLYSIDPATARLIKLNFEGIWIGARNDNPPFEVLHDFAEDGLTVPTFAGVGAKDTIFTAYFGAQDYPECHRVAAYHSSGKVSILDTTAGTVDGMPVSTPDRFFLHGAHLSDPSGEWMWLTKSVNSPGGAPLYAWAIGSPLLLPIGPYNDGHITANAQGFFNNAWLPPEAPASGYPSLLFRRWQDFSTDHVVGLNTNGTPHPPTYDTHPTTKNDPYGRGGLPVFTSTTASHTSAAYENEIIAWQQPGPVLRFGRTFNSGLPESGFQAQNAVGAVSQTGKFYAFTTDGERTLEGRYDVFLLALP
jgi:hypothetical protein